MARVWVWLILSFGASMVSGCGVAPGPAQQTFPASAAAAVGSGLNWESCGGPPYPYLPGDPPSAELAACVAASGPPAKETLVVEIGGDTPSPLQAPGEVGDNSPLITSAPVSLEWHTEKGSFLFDNVGGMGQTILIIHFDRETRSVESASFAWQNRPLTLQEALGKGRRLENWLMMSGFEFDMSSSHRRFALVDDYQSTPSGASDWAAAEARLSKDEQVSEMILYRMDSAGADIQVSIQNSRRKAGDFGSRTASPLPEGYPRSIYDGNGGYEWQIHIWISEPR